MLADRPAFASAQQPRTYSRVCHKLADRWRYFRAVDYLVALRGPTIVSLMVCDRRYRARPSIFGRVSPHLCAGPSVVPVSSGWSRLSGWGLSGPCYGDVCWSALNWESRSHSAAPSEIPERPLGGVGRVGYALGLPGICTFSEKKMR